jgi:predicted ribosomally synthesized peptide with SipW-like signal peptide
MKKILGLVVALVAVVAMLGTGTWAYFNDVLAVEDNTITAGSLYFGTSTTSPLTLGNKEPGNSGSEKLLDNMKTPVASMVRFISGWNIWSIMKYS